MYVIFSNSFIFFLTHFWGVFDFRFGRFLCAKFKFTISYDETTYSSHCVLFCMTK